MNDWEKRRRPYKGNNDWLRAVNEAVYYAPGWEDWQIFRQSLKGLPIDEKLDTLRTAWGVFSHTLDDEELYIERIRFVNYLGALLRGGFEEARPMYNKLKEGGL
jgi:hypothetical protein